MRLHPGITVWLCVSGFMAGCGGAESGPSGPTSRQEPLTQTCNSDYLLDFYSDDTYQVWVGDELCQCGQPPNLSGRKTPYSRWGREPTNCD